MSCAPILRALYDKTKLGRIRPSTTIQQGPKRRGELSTAACTVFIYAIPKNGGTTGRLVLRLQQHLCV